MKDYIKKILADSAGIPSSKRIISIVFTIIIAGTFIANVGWGLTVADNLLDAAMIIVIAGLGFTGVEKFAPAVKSKIQDQTSAE